MPSAGDGARGEVPRRARLTRERVLLAALAVVDREGVEGLSMRRLGAELGVEAMSLYNHVAGKDDVLDGLVGVLWDGVADSDEHDGDWQQGDWQQRVRAFALGVRRVALAHPNAYPLVLTRGLLPPQALTLTASLLTSLREAGFGQASVEAMRVAANHAVGSVLAELAWYERSEAAASAADAGVAHGGVPANDVARTLLECDTDELFEIGLDVLLRGLRDLKRSEGRPRDR